MKKLISLAAALLLATPAFGAGLSVNGVPVEGDFPIIDGRIYAPVYVVSGIFGDPHGAVELDGVNYVPVRDNCDAAGHTVNWNSDTATAEITTADVYNDLDGRYYSLTVAGKTLGVENGSEENGALLVAGDSGDSWCFSSRGDGYYGLLSRTGGKAIDIPASNRDAGIGATQYTSNSGDNQTLKLVPSGGGYALQFKHSELYLTLGADGYLSQEVFTGRENQIFTLTYAGDSSMRTVRESEGYKLLDEKTRERFDSYIYKSQAYTANVYSQAAALIESENYSEKTPEEQKEILERCLSITAFNLVYIGEVPPSEEVAVEITNKTYFPEYDVWRGSIEPVWCYDVAMSDGYTMNLITTVEDCSVVQDAANALARFPLAMRKHLRRLIHRMDDANNYNGGGDTIWIRLNYIPGENAIAQTLAHELGHVLDTSLTSDYSVWEKAIAADMVPVSGYGNNNRTEDLAEFSRIYHMARRSDSVMEAIGEVYPNRMKAYKALLYAADSEYYADFKAEFEEFLPFTVGEEAAYSVIAPANSKLVLTALNETNTPGERLTLAVDEGKDTQRWWVRRRKDGDVVIFNKATGYCVNVSGESMENGGMVISWNGMGGANETWSLIEGEGGAFCLRASHSGLYLGFSGVDVVQTADETLWTVTAAE